MIKPINKSILVKKITEDTNKFVIETNRTKGEVVAVAKDCESEIKVGDIVYFDDNSTQDLDGFKIIRENYVIAIADDKE